MLLSLPTLNPVKGSPPAQLWEVHSHGWWEEGLPCSQGAGEIFSKAVSSGSPALAWRVTLGTWRCLSRLWFPKRGKFFRKSMSCLVELEAHWFGYHLPRGSQPAGEPQHCVAAPCVQDCGCGLVHVLVPMLRRGSGQEHLAFCTPFPSPISTECGRREWAEGTSALGQRLCIMAHSVARLCALNRG